MNEVKHMKFNTSETQIKSIMKKYFIHKCELCSAQIDTLEMAKVHYLSEHENPKGYLRCCGNKFMNKSETLDHIQYHIDPDIFRLKCSTICHLLTRLVFVFITEFLQLQFEKYTRPCCFLYISDVECVKNGVKTELISSLI